MKESVYKTYDDLPLFLNADMVANVLGISAASSYELMHEKDFPVLKIGNRMVVPDVRGSNGETPLQADSGDGHGDERHPRLHPNRCRLFTKVTRKQCAECKSHQRPADL